MRAGGRSRQYPRREAREHRPGACAGFTWWSLGIGIGLGLTVGYALHLREEVLEVPISAMLIMSARPRRNRTWRLPRGAAATAALVAPADQVTG